MKTVTVTTETELKVPVALPDTKPVYCTTLIEIEYTQRDTVVDIAGTISSADCAACSGEYEILVSVRNAAGRLETLRFPGTWERGDDKPVAFKGQYPIGPNVDVVRARAVQSRCTCVDSSR